MHYIICDIDPSLLYLLIPKLISFLVLNGIGLYLFLLQAIIAKPELIDASYFVLAFMLNRAGPVETRNVLFGNQRIAQSIVFIIIFDQSVGQGIAFFHTQPFTD